MKFCPKCTNIVGDSTTNCPACGAGIEGSRKESLSGSYYDGHSMRWFDFLIKWSLFATAIWNVINSILLMNSGTYEIHMVFGYQYDDYTLVFGLVGILYAIYALYTRFMLSNYTKPGPYLLYGLIAFPVISHIAEGLWVINMCSGNTVAYELVVSQVYSDIVVTLIWQSILLVCNCIYFTKRKSLFVN